MNKGTNMNKVSITVILFFVFFTLEAQTRVTEGLQVLYKFNEGSGSTINDVSGVGTAFNLKINNTANVTWGSNYLQTKGEATIKSLTTATKIINACKSSNELTYEIWFSPTDNVQRSIVARMMTMTNTDHHAANIKLWQKTDDYGFHCRDASTTDLNGIEWKFYDFPIKLRHFIFTRSSDGQERLYMDNELLSPEKYNQEDSVAGDFSTWDNNFYMYLSGDAIAGFYWLGKYYKVAVYSKSLTEAEVAQNYNAGLVEYGVAPISDITTTNLIGDHLNNGEYGGHGIYWGDSDSDGDPDLYITMNATSPMADQFFENNGGMLTEKAAEKGIDNAIEDATTKGSHGWVWADLDNDGDYDGWNGSYARNIPYRNKNNQPGYFEDMFSTSGIENIQLGTRGVTAFDYDNDGDLDLFGNNFYARNQKQENEFYRNNGNFTFTRIDNGLRSPIGDQGVCDGDIDNDGDMDLALAVFEGNTDGRCVEIMENVNGQFIELQNTGLTLCNASIDGVTFWDMNNDGWLDVVSGYKIFLNDHDKTFTEVSNVPSGFRFMRGIADIDNDGDWDLVDPLSGKVHLNNGNLTFTTTSYTTGFASSDPSITDLRCVSFADIDLDGDVDFAVGVKNLYNRLYKNDYSGNNNYLFVKLKSADGQAGAFGAKVYLYSVTGDTLLSYRQAHSSQGYLSQDDPVMHFGCGNREQVKVKVVFLNNNQSTIEFVTNTDRTVNITDFYPDLVAPSTPTNFNLIGSLDKVELSWNKNLEEDVETYEIYRSLNLDFDPDTMAAFTYSIADTFFTDTNIVYGNNYYYSIAAVDTAGNKSEFSGILSVSIADTIAPQIPMGLMIEQNEVNAASLKWNKNIENDLNNYKIYRSFESNFDPDTLATYTYSTSDTFFVDSNVEIGKHYYYKISATDIHENESEYSDEVSLLLVSIEDKSIVPTSYALYQNYPNPFNPVTKINYQIPQPGKVKIAVFDMLGKEVAVIENNIKDAGYYTLQFDGSNISSGIYFYKIIAGSFIETKKLVLMK